MTSSAHHASVASAILGIGLLGAPAQAADANLTAAPVVHAEIWPELRPSVTDSASAKAFVADLLHRMSTQEKVGQIIQADISSIKPDDLLEYPLGSISSGGTSAPNDNDYSPPKDWLALADAFFEANRARGGTYVPLLWGTDAVHGHNNIPGATIFPHNIGLGAANDPELVRKIGEVTAQEMATTGEEWTFAPTVAVARDDHWGRTYESYSEDPEIVASTPVPSFRVFRAFREVPASFGTVMYWLRRSTSWATVERRTAKTRAIIWQANRSCATFTFPAT